MSKLTNRFYPGKGDWWSDFLHYRAKAIKALREQNKSWDEIARTLNLADGAHAERIHSANLDIGAEPPAPGQSGQSSSTDKSGEASPADKIELIHLDDEENGPSVICKGHVDKLSFAKLLYGDDVACFLGRDYEEDSKGRPLPSELEALVPQISHTWGIWEKRYWKECRKQDVGAQPFTMIN